MTTMSDMVEEWIRIRSTLQRQLKTLQSGEMQSGDATLTATADSTIIRLKAWIADLNTVLKEHARDHRS